MFQNKLAQRGYFGIGVFNAKTEANIGLLMRSAFCFGADFIFTIGKRYEHQATDTTWTERHHPLFHYKDFEDFLSHKPLKSNLIAVELDDSAKSLYSYCHPESAIYLLGAEDNGIPKDILNMCDSIIAIPHLAMCLNVSVAGSIVMNDRINKRSGLTNSHKIREHRHKIIGEKLIKEWEIDC